MQKPLLKKGIAVAVIVLFITMGATPCIGGNLAEKLNNYDIQIKNNSIQEIFFRFTLYKLWNKTLVRSNDDVSTSVLPDIDDGYIITGYTKSYGAEGKNAWLIKIEDEPQLNHTFFFGYVTNISQLDDFIKFKAQNLFYLSFSPLSFGSFSSGEEIIAKQMLALTIEGNPGIVIGFYKTSL
ncbi:MAG: hypothetical protein JSW60_00225 [Thermoplasmatales archaeon]|nr:MAG: hypothetical protein JSW60_00225 [Thermoplasmatales archaeon]